MCFFSECAAGCGRRATDRTTIVLAPDLVLEVGLCPLCTVIAADIERRRHLLRTARDRVLELEDLNLGGVPVIPLPVRR